MNHESEERGEPWGRRLWLALVLATTVSGGLQTYGIATWPMADDEVPSLVEMGLADVPAQAFSVPEGQVGKLPRALPVWYKSQRFMIDLLPKSEVSYRLPSVLWGILTAAVVFAVAARWRGLWFAAALAVIMNGSQLFIYVMQVDRFYSLPLLLLTGVVSTIWLVRGRVLGIVLILTLTPLCVLSHNVTIAVFGLAVVASATTFGLRLTGVEPLIRSATALAAALLVYVFYLRAIVTGWNSTGNPTPVLVSFAAHAGIPALALAALGGFLGAWDWKRRGVMVWWLLMFIGGFCAFELASISWNPRYFLFFLPPVWILAAHGIETVARRLDFGIKGLAWYGCVVVVLSPSLVSHFLDGSRHDYRQAAAVIMAADTSGTKPILSDDAETISYYLPAEFRRNLFVRTKVTRAPEQDFYLVTRSNAWLPLPRVGNRRMDLLAEISTRRYDQFSHILRVYRVTAGSAD